MFDSPAAPFTVRGYGRASSEVQIISTEQQEAVVIEAFKSFQRFKPGWDKAEWGGFYADEATSRTTIFRKRPVGSLIVAMSRPGDTIMGAKYDRVFANVVDVCETLELIAQRQFRMLILDLDIPLDTDLGQAVFKIMAAVKELEVKEIRARTRNVAAYRKANGLPQGTSPVGWKTVIVNLRGSETSFFAIDEPAREHAMKILALKEGRGLRELMRYLNDNRIRNFWGRKWNAMTLIHWLKAARNNFPLHNGQHEAPPIPADANPIPTLGNPN